MDSHLVNVALGIAGVFALFSLLVSALQEIVAGLLKTRARQLARGIADLLGSDLARKAMYDHPLLRSVAPPPNLVSGLQGDGGAAPIKASYISARTFVTTLMDLYLDPQGTLGAVESQAQAVLTQLQAGHSSGVVGLQAALTRAAAGVPGAPAATMLTNLASTLDPLAAKSSADALQAFVSVWPEALRTQLLSRAGGVSGQLEQALRALTAQGVSSIEQLREALESWYDEAMDRVSGLYKRWTMGVQFTIGLVLAFGMNVDTVAIVGALHADPARAQAVADQMAQLPNGRSASRLLQATPGGDVASWRVIPTSWNEVLVERGDGRTMPPVLRPQGEQPAPDLVCTERQRVGGGPLFGCSFTDVHVTKREGVVYDVCETNAETCTSAGTLTFAFVDGPETLRADMVAELSKLDLPIGWPADVPAVQRFRHITFASLLGWLLTAAAASLGAPFWFDLLKKAANLRAAGRKPASSTS